MKGYGRLLLGIQSNANRHEQNQKCNQLKKRERALGCNRGVDFVTFGMVSVWPPATSLGSHRNRVRMEQPEG